MMPKIAHSRPPLPSGSPFGDEFARAGREVLELAVGPGSLKAAAGRLRPVLGPLPSLPVLMPAGLPALASHEILDDLRRQQELTSRVYLLA